MNKNGFLEAIRTGRLTMSDDELLIASQLLNEERAIRKKRNAGTMKMTLKVGDKVFFTDYKHVIQEGEVKKVKYKKAIVKTAMATWDVPLGVLRYSK